MTPNTRKPTKEEVGDTELCWAFWRWQWGLVSGESIRMDWSDDNLYTAWLPYSAIPDPNNQQQGEPK